MEKMREHKPGRAGSDNSDLSAYFCGHCRKSFYAVGPLYRAQ
jgi:hypothetical protein